MDPSVLEAEKSNGGSFELSSPGEKRGTGGEKVFIFPTRGRESGSIVPIFIEESMTDP